jgi:hypothetical protein
MEKAVLELDLAKARVSKAGLVSAGLHLRLNNLLFPHAEWTDFTVVVLQWWVTAALSLLRGEQQTVEVRFMEGPFLVTIEARSERTWILKLIEAGHRADVKAESTVEALPLIRSILSASDAVLTLCRERQWWSSDAETLVRSLAQLKSTCP